MRVVVVVLLVLVGLYYVFVYPRRNDGDRNMFMVVVVLLVLAPTVFFEVRWQNIEMRAGEVTRVLSGNESGYVHCQRFSETFMDATQSLGFVSWDAADRSFVKFDQCQELGGFLLSGGADVSAAQVQAVHVISHEAFHVAGVYVEAEAECYAVQSNFDAAQLFGASVVDAERLAVFYWEELYPLMPDGYKSSDCVENGLYDLSPGDGSFLLPVG